MVGNVARGSGLIALLVACGSASDGTGGTGGTGASENSGSSGSGAGGAAPDPETTTASEVQDRVGKLDLLLMIDNSVSMNDKQEVLRLAVPELVTRLTNPACVDGAGGVFSPPAAGEPCPSGQRREFAALLDVNIGVVSSSLGDVGANASCSAIAEAGFYEPARVDMAHLLGSLPRGRNPSSNAAGFLEWRAGTEATLFDRDVQKMVTDVGDGGCGFESQLEAWYRFLVDPYPYRALEHVPCPNGGSLDPDCVRPETDAQGRLLLDEVLLEQRAAFLRPDSLVLIVMLTDENDCSVIVGNQAWAVLNVADSRPMFRGSSACADNPNDKCCYPCPAPPPAGCPADPICNADRSLGILEDRLPAALDGQNVRCFDQKRRFGANLLYPIERYVNALREPTICWNAADLNVAGCPPEYQVDNPLFAGGRPAHRVFLAGILGVPWQAIAANADVTGSPLPAGVLRFQSATELTASGTWSAILGSPGTPWQPATAERPEVAGTPPIPPTLPQMIEATEPRPGVVPGNPLNGRDHATRYRGMGPPEDLEYACIFPLSAPRDCAALTPDQACGCPPDSTDTALCEQQPGQSAAGTTQYWAKAYPSSRPLDVLRGHGDNAILASICARNVSDPSASDFGYRPAMTAILERLRSRLPE